MTTRNLTEKDVEREERRRQDEMRRELEKVKKRRLVSECGQKEGARSVMVLAHRRERRKEKQEKRSWLVFK